MGPAYTSVTRHKLIFDNFQKPVIALVVFVLAYWIFEVDSRTQFPAERGLNSPELTTCQGKKVLTHA